jgi:hypothetical protein
MASNPQIHRMLPIVTCAECQVWMPPIVIDSLPADRIDVIYRCITCGVEAERRIKWRGK